MFHKTVIMGPFCKKHGTSLLFLKMDVKGTPLNRVFVSFWFPFQFTKEAPSKKGTPKWTPSWMVLKSEALEGSTPSTERDSYRSNSARRSTASRSCGLAQSGVRVSWGLLGKPTGSTMALLVCDTKLKATNNRAP